MRQSLFIKNLVIGPGQPLCIITGPCVIESEDHAFSCASKLKELLEKRPVSFIFKASYDKANRSSYQSFRGPGLEEGLRILERIQKELDVPVLTDVHSPEEASIAGQVCDVIQIPAYLCRQTDLLIAAGQSGAVVNVKKGQFLAPWDMHNVVEKLTSVDCHRILMTERGYSFGYNNLVSDMRSIPIMQGLGYPVCFDASHSVQLPGGLGTSSGGQREHIPTLAKAAVASGADSIFIESHPKPLEAKSDKASVFPLDQLGKLISQLEQIHELSQTFESFDF